MMPRLPAGPCSLQSRHDNKTNNFLDLLSWTPFIFPPPQGRTDLMVGPKCGSCTVTGGWGRPGRAGLGQAGLPVSRPAASLLPVPSLYCLHSPPSLHLSPSSFLSLAAASFLLTLLSQFFSLPSWCAFLPLFVCPFSVSPSPPSLSSLPPSLGSQLSSPSSPPLPGPLLAASLGPLSLCAPCGAGQTQVVLFPGICGPVAAREGAAGWPGREGGALLGSPRSSHWPLQAGRVQGGQTLV